MMPPPIERNCPLCDAVPNFCSFEIDRHAFAVECPICGRFKITEIALSALRADQKFLLSAFCRRARSGSNFVTILSDNIEQLIRALPKFSPPEKLDNLLQLMGEMSPALG